MLPIDIVYLFRHSRQHDREILYSLRSVARNLPWVRKVWVFGDRPAFLSADRRLIEHVPHEYVAPLLGLRTPVRNDFLLIALASLLPGVAFDFLRFADDCVVLQPLTPEQFLAPRAHEDLTRVNGGGHSPPDAGARRGTGRWKEMLWRTYDLLKQHGYAGYNFEAHVPQPLTKELVFEAFLAFRPFIAEERYAGILAQTTIFNYALKHHALKFTWLADEKSKAGFYGRGLLQSAGNKPDLPAEPPHIEQIVAACRGKLFLSFDDDGFTPAMESYLSERFAWPCQFERDWG